jgi:hypothetical protein
MTPVVSAIGSAVQKLLSPLKFFAEGLQILTEKLVKWGFLSPDSAKAKDGKGGGGFLSGFGGFSMDLYSAITSPSRERKQ